MIKSFSGQVEYCFPIPEPYLLTLAKTDYPSIFFSSPDSMGLEPVSVRASVRSSVRASVHTFKH